VLNTFQAILKPASQAPAWRGLVKLDQQTGNASPALHLHDASRCQQHNDQI
jgi:hypothetical protein